MKRMMEQNIDIILQHLKIAIDRSLIDQKFLEYLIENHLKFY